MEVPCTVCGKGVETNTARLETGRPRFCSPICGNFQRKNPIVSCPICGEKFHPTNNRRKYCSRECALPNFKKRTNPTERFWKQVDRTSSPNGCWLWAGYKDKLGYGSFSIFRDGKWKVTKAHKYAMELVLGKLPDGVLALHRCDNPSCVFIEHLFTGTNADNMADKVSKGRQSRGEASGRSKLTEEQVREIRKRFLVGESGIKIAADYGMSRSLIYSIGNGESWKHVI